MGKCSPICFLKTSFWGPQFTTLSPKTGFTHLVSRHPNASLDMISRTYIANFRFSLAKFGSQINGMGFSEATCKTSAQRGVRMSAHQMSTTSFWWQCSELRFSETGFQKADWWRFSHLKTGLWWSQISLQTSLQVIIMGTFQVPLWITPASTS